MKVVGIIPARLESSRLPQKPLIMIDGLPMIVHTYKRASLAAELDDVYVATDSERIVEVVKQHGGKALLTSDKHPTGSDRIAEAAQKIDADVVVNINGDEPLLNPAHIDKIVSVMRADETIPIAFLVTPYTYTGRTSDFKAVLDLDYNVLYSSRSDIPDDSRKGIEHRWKVCFIVPFKKDFLAQYASWEQTPLELAESYEYLRVLEHGYKIKAVPVDNAVISVDTPEDLEIVTDLMTKDELRKKY